MYVLVGQAAAWLQLIKVLRHPRRDTRALSLPALILWTLVGIAAFGYGLSLGEWPLILNNGITMALNASLAGMKARNAVKYRHVCIIREVQLDLP